MKTQGKILLAVFSSGLALTSCNTKQPEAGLPPNIIFILADDLGYGDVGFQGQQHFATPHLDRMAAEGLIFSDHYAGSTVCAPSRSSLMTGQHTGNTYIRGNRRHEPEGQEPLPEETLTIAKLLQQAGYATGAFGKWGLGGPGTSGDPANQGFDEFFGFKCQTLAHNYYPYYLWHNDQKIILPGNEGTATGEYAADNIHREAIRFLAENNPQKTGKPFFMYYPSIIPHAELFAPEKYMEKHRGKYPEEQPYTGVDDGPQFRKGPYGSQAEPRTAFAAMVNLLDDQVGEILEKLNEMGIAENTLVIFTSDNGPHREGGADPDYFNSNGPLRGYKRDLYEGGTRVPFIAWWPGKIAPGKTNHISAFWDFFPTVVELAGLKFDGNTDGISYLPTLLGKPEKQQEHSWLYWEFHERGRAQAVRIGNWKGVRQPIEKPLELYNLDTDIGETQDVANNHPEITQQMEQILQTARTESELWPWN